MQKKKPFWMNKTHGLRYMQETFIMLNCAKRFRVNAAHYSYNSGLTPHIIPTIPG